MAAFDDGQYFELKIWNSEERILWKTEAAKAHAGWLSLFLCQSDGADYLLRYTPSMSQGMCHYQYDLWWLDNEEGFTYDKTANLSDILAAYKKYRESR